MTFHCWLFHCWVFRTVTDDIPLLGIPSLGIPLLGIPVILPRIPTTKKPNFSVGYSGRWVFPLLGIVDVEYSAQLPFYIFLLKSLFTKKSKQGIHNDLIDEIW